MNDCGAELPCWSTLDGDVNEKYTYTVFSHRDLGVVGLRSLTYPNTPFTFGARSGLELQTLELSSIKAVREPEVILRKNQNAEE